LLDRLTNGGGKDGDWLVARRQSAGRGRLGRTWAGQVGNFHGSTIITLKPGDPPAPTLALVAALALHAAIVDLTRGLCAPVIKWPNDLLVDGAKLAGILLERSGNAIVAGLGVNLAWSPALPGRQTISLAALGHDVPVESMATTLASIFATELQRWRSEPIAALTVRWLANAHPRGTPLTISEGADAGLTGAFDGLDETGNLRLRLSGGETRTIHAGEVRLVSAP
jgi:BirA family transcriptional regulator, biotin operon repressor / biotin---[acetyl-CoA-carboxylase] ligase